MGGSESKKSTHLEVSRRWKHPSPNWLQQLPERDGQTGRREREREKTEGKKAHKEPRSDG